VRRHSLPVYSMDPYDSHYRGQTGGGIDFSIGPVYRAGFSKQRGRGFGSFLRSVLSYVSPLFKSGAQALGKAALSTGANIISDVAASDGSPISIKEIAKRRAVETRDNMVRRMRGGGRRRKRVRKVAKRTAKTVVRPKTRRKRRVRKIRTKSDIFAGL